MLIWLDSVSIIYAPSSNVNPPDKFFSLPAKPAD